jgi:hypothetical protein
MSDYITGNESGRESVAKTRPVTREMVYGRTLELASLAGRNSLQIKQVDYEQAKREITGESDFDRQQSLLGNRW